MHLNDAIARHSMLNKTFFHHEQAAAMAADGYFRLSNKSALVNVTTGPGGVNAPADEVELNMLRSQYYACCAEVDASFGRLFEFLKERGMWDKTVIIFTAE